MNRLSVRWGILPAALLGLVLVSPAARASSLKGDYFKLPAGHVDTGNGIDGVVTGLVQPTLGPNGLPMVSAFGKTRSGGSGPIHDYDPSTGEIGWWSPNPISGVLFEKTATDTLPLYQSSFYPDGQGNDAAYFRSAHWQGTFDLAAPGSATFSLGSDDDAFVFVDGQLKVDDGGIHGFSYVPNVVQGLSAGQHKLDVFFADRYRTQSSIKLDADVKLDPTPPAVPEPSSLMLLGAAFPGLLALRRRGTVRK